MKGTEEWKFFVSRRSRIVKRPPGFRGSVFLYLNWRVTRVCPKRFCNFLYSMITTSFHNNSVSIHTINTARPLLKILPLGISIRRRGKTVPGRQLSVCERLSRAVREDSLKTERVWRPVLTIFIRLRGRIPWLFCLIFTKSSPILSI